MTITTDDIRAYLADRYNVDAESVKNGLEADEDEAGLYYGEDHAWLVYGTMPNTNEDGWFFAGYAQDIEQEMHANSAQ